MNKKYWMEPIDGRILHLSYDEARHCTSRMRSIIARCHQSTERGPNQYQPQFALIMVPSSVYELGRTERARAGVAGYTKQYGKEEDYARLRKILDISREAYITSRGGFDPTLFSGYKKTEAGSKALVKIRRLLNEVAN